MTEEHLWKLVHDAEDECDSRIEYAIIQPKMINRKEYKVVVLGGKAQYIANCGRYTNFGRAYSSFPHTSLYKFAEYAVQALKRGCPGAITDGIIRVDIFQSLNEEGRLVVNEFESLDASVYGKDDRIAKEFMRNYWLHQIKLAFPTLFPY